MPEEPKDATKEVTEGLRSIFARLGEFFHLFDLSFFVSGTVTFGAFSVLYVKVDAPRTFPFTNWVGAVALIVSCYVCGLISFAAGRLLNGRTFRKKKLAEVLETALTEHEVGSPIIEKYLTAYPEKRLWRLYIRLWQDIAQTRSQSVAFSHLSRYWVMAATYDGLAASFILWAITSLLVSSSAVAKQPISSIAAAIICAAFLGASLLCLQQAANYYEYQIEDLVASLAATRANL